ncbi:GAF domain-containing sensor histidine kinase [Fischerella thermalis]|uniref:GAF domain-containing sensor histidine kinase n=1 Tax=Fischerella thermalis TaxID=372787 RepID=UPI000C80B439|nr:GAF domain-containing protein [Fischerella thermalis]PLZ05938.1 ATP-binding protein [Fischerella thermalis WC114]PLZ11061.1 ATP-binding protein [Fischerella thermalis WC1110]PLZ13362.1 ATP-binding protein [Fischerella thermalis WC119]PLZ17439.1 ATP-binding protein [Fischerella thermalis WC157]PLZ42872.1 ATP-binding protein [Fischerella thermalis WC538]
MRQQQKLTAAEQKIISLGRVLQSLREEDHVDALIATTISYLQEQFEYSLIWIALYDRLNHILFGQGGVIPSGNTSYLQQRVVLNPGDLLEQVVIEQRPLGVADLRAEIRIEAWQQLAQQFNIQGTIVVPICYKNRCLGLVLLGSERWGYLLGGEARARLMMVVGELGAALYEREMDLQHKQTKRLDEPLLRLLNNLQTLNHLEQRLEAVLETTQEFILPTRTNIYWFDREGYYFWRRLSNKKNHQETTAKITVHELSDFYIALSVNEIVWIGEGRSSLKSNFTVKLLQRFGVRSLLAAPIIWQKDLLGFLTVESTEARIWTEAEKNFTKTAASLISLVAPLEDTESTIKEIQNDAYLTSQIARGIYSDYDIQQILDLYATKVLQRLLATRFLLLHYDPEQNNYQIFYQNQLHHLRPLMYSLEALKDVDWQLLLRSTEAVAIENLEIDLRFFNWHPHLLENGVRSLIVCNCAFGQEPKVLLALATETHRSWTSVEKELVQVVAQQIGITIRQWQLHRQTQQQQKILQSFQQCLRILEQSQDSPTQPIQHLERTALEQIAAILNCSLTILLSWQPGENVAKIIPGIIANSEFEIVTDTPIPLQSEALIQWALLTDELLPITANDLPPATKKWLTGAGVGQILVMALRTTADYQPTGVVVIADHWQRRWSEDSLLTTETLVCQLAWSRRWLQITQMLESRTEELRQLNWYKHRRLEDIQRTVTQLLVQMDDLGIPTNELTHMRYQQLLRQLDNTTASMTALLKLELWQLQMSWETVPIASLLKRSLERVDNLLKQQRLWVGVHGLGQQEGEESSKNYSLLPHSSLAIAGDIVKIELILHELLVCACQRSTTGGRIDIWCRRLDEQFLEVSITDNGDIESQLLTELHQDTPKDILAPSRLEQLPGLHLFICQKLMLQLGGELHFYQLPDGRIVSRLLLPLARSRA